MLSVNVPELAEPPRVRIVTNALKVWRIQDGERIEVRGSVIGGVIEDFEVEQERVVSYTDGITTSLQVHIPSLSPDLWLVPPGDPASAVRLVVDKQGGYAALQLKAYRDVVEVPGLEEPVVVEWGRSAPSTTIAVHVLDVESLERLLVVLRRGGPVFLSIPTSHWPAYRFLSWVSIGDVDPSPTGPVHAPRWRVQLPVTAVGRPLEVTRAGGTIGDLEGTIGELQGTIGDLGTS